MKIALLQMNIQLYDREANKHKVRSMLEQAMGKAPELDLVILPELWTFPFLFKEDKESMTRQLAEYGEEYEGETLQLVSATVISFPFSKAFVSPHHSQR